MRKYFNIPDIITDDFIIQNFKLKNTDNDINPSRTSSIFLNQYPTIKEYIENRYDDSTSIYETFYRIFHHIEHRPKCKACGKVLEFNHNHKFREFCSQKCVQNFEDVIQKKSKTRKRKVTEYKYLGYDFYQEVKKKREATCLKKYGVKSASQSELIKEKIKQTNINRLGVPYTAQNKKCLEKMRQTCMERYGVDHNFKIPGIKEHIKETWIEKYGCENPMQNENILQKNFDSKKKHNSYKQSKPEELLYEYLCNRYGTDDILRQYKSDLYPYNCDFYIKSLDLYIELQGYWSHGYHPFNPNDKNDIERLNKLISRKDKSGYAHAIDVWTVRDVNKREIAKQNNLNYLEIFSIKKEEIINKFEEYIKIKNFNI